jgi:hypothetical protein
MIYIDYKQAGLANKNIYLVLSCSTRTVNYSIVAVALLIIASGAALIYSFSLATKVNERRKHFEKLE